MEALGHMHFQNLQWINEKLSSELQLQARELAEARELAQKRRLAEVQELALLESGASLATASAQAQKVFSSSGMLPLLMGLGMGRDIMKVCAACICCLVLMKLFSKIGCGGRRCNCRRCKPCARMLLESGYDEFETFEVLVTIHSISDIVKDGLLGGKEFKVKISFGWSKWETFATKDCKWEQTKGLEVPQGSSECVVELYSCGKLKDSRLAEHVLEVKRDMLDKDEEFWGTKQKFKLEEKGKIVGVLSATFRRKEGGDGEGGAAGLVPIAGVDEDSALAVELMEAMQELESTPGFVKPEGKWEGDLKVGLLAKVLSGDLREVNEKNGKEKGKVYVRVLQCNVAELKGAEMQEQMQKQIAKAKKKGLSAPAMKWYWVWYEDKKTAMDRTRWHYPDGFIPMISVMRVGRSPNRNDQFIVSYYAEDGKKCSLIYRREGGKGLECWVEGLDLAYSECRKQVKDSKKKEETEDNAMGRMRQMHKQWVQRHGMPRNDEQWTQWFEWFKGNNYDEDLIKKLFTEISAQGAPAQQSQQQRQPQQAQQQQQQQQRPPPQQQPQQQQQRPQPQQQQQPQQQPQQYQQQQQQYQQYQQQQLQYQQYQQYQQQQQQQQRGKSPQTPTKKK